MMQLINEDFLVAVTARDCNKLRDWLETDEFNSDNALHLEFVIHILNNFEELGQLDKISELTID